MRGRAPAKAILFGEHAVVYGYPAIAFPIRSLFCEITAARSRNEQTIILAPQTDEILNVETEHGHPLVQAWRLAQESVGGVLPGAVFKINSNIPIAAGFGSGAALSAAMIRASMELAGERLPLREQNELVFSLEKRYHGNPSGIDNYVVVYEKPLCFKKTQLPEFLQWPTEIPIIGLQCGAGAATHEVVADVRKRRNIHPPFYDSVFKAIGAIATAANQALMRGDLVKVGELMFENHVYLRKLGVSSPQQDELVELVRRNGALGAKMSGAGWGGQVLVLTSSDLLEDFPQLLDQTGHPIVFRERII